MQLFRCASSATGASFFCSVRRQGQGAALHDFHALKVLQIMHTTPQWRDIRSGHVCIVRFLCYVVVRKTIGRGKYIFKKKFKLCIRLTHSDNILYTFMISFNLYRYLLYFYHLNPPLHGRFYRPKNIIL